MIKKYVLFTFFGLILWFSYAPSANAFFWLPELSLPFGGLVSYSLPCTCPSSTGNLWIYFTPLFLGSNIPATGSLVYVPTSSKLYAWYSIGTPTAWHLGSYTPGVQACYMVAPPPATGCIIFPSAGVINSVGTSKPFGF